MLSMLLPGAGQLYNGEVKRGVKMLFGAMAGGLLGVVVGVLLAVMVGGSLGVTVGGVLSSGLLYVVMVLWSMVDAYKVASRERRLRRSAHGQGSAPAIG